jgi:hypothetical protein
MPRLKYWDAGSSTYKFVPVGGGGGGGGNTRTVSSISGATTAAAAASTDYYYICTAALTLTLPTAVGNTNQYTVKSKVAGTITIATTASQTIDGASTYALGTQYQSVVLLSDSANWIVVQEYMTRTVVGTLTATSFVEA